MSDGITVQYVHTVNPTMLRKRARQDIGLTSLIDRIDFCLENKVISYIDQYKNKHGEHTICITSQILKEISRKKIGNNNLNTLRDIANEIPFFACDTRVIGGKSVKAAYGPRRYFIDFVTVHPFE